jgi:hypothetical protein
MTVFNIYESKFPDMPFQSVSIFPRSRSHSQISVLTHNR